jgi:hypothetical protein
MGDFTARKSKFESVHSVLPMNRFCVIHSISPAFSRK